METRKHGNVLNTSRLTLSSEVPVDYTKMVKEILGNHFLETLEKIEKKLKAKFSWHVQGRIFADEIVLATSLLPDTGIAATTGYASIDYDPKASHPTAEESLSFCLDAMGSLFDLLIGDDEGKNWEALLKESLGSFKDIPLEWAEVEIQKKRVFVRFDRSNPKLDQLATEWLSKHDSVLHEDEVEHEVQASDLFVRGPRTATPEEDEDDS